MQLLQRRRNMRETLTNANHAPLPPENIKNKAHQAEEGETAHEAEGIEREEPEQQERGDAAAEEGPNGGEQERVTAPEEEARGVPQQTTREEAAVGEETRWGAEAMAGLTTTEATVGGGAGALLLRTTAAGTIESTGPGRGEGAQRSRGNAGTAEEGGQLPPAARQKMVGAVVDGERSRRGPEGGDESAREVNDRSAPGDEKGNRPPRARPGQQRLGAGLAPGRPEPLTGWEQQERHSTASHGERGVACPPSNESVQAQEGTGGEHQPMDHNYNEGEEEGITSATGNHDA
ncbi:unnamed protein product [Closterium sp. Naga37s-1]|nr:unnamed protein product [Closterium sp. Naga37s-1]